MRNNREIDLVKYTSILKFKCHQLIPPKLVHATPEWATVIFVLSTEERMLFFHNLPIEVAAMFVVITLIVIFYQFFYAT